MADIYVRSTDGNNADSGATWALAKATAAGAAGIDAAGDRVFFSGNAPHSESTAGAIAITWAGTRAAPMQLLSVSDAAEPPTALSAGAVIATTGANAIQLGGHFYAHGLSLIAGDSTNAADVQLGTQANDVQVLENCRLEMRGSGSGARFRVPQVSSSKAELINPTIDFSATGQLWLPIGELVIRGGSFDAASSTPSTAVFQHNTAANRGLVSIDGLDFSNLAATVDLFSVTAAGFRGVVRNCKLPASWSGDLVNAAITAPSARVEMWNCDSGDTNYRLWIEDYAGNIKHETTLVKTGGASDGTTPIAWKMVTVADAEYPLNVLRSPEIRSEWIETVGSPVTLTVDILHDSATALTDAEVWVEVQYLGDASTPKGSFVTDAKANVLASAANQASSAATWTTTGMANPNEQKLEVTFTPEQKGVALVTVCVAKASYTLYVDPVAQLS